MPRSRTVSFAVLCSGLLFASSASWAISDAKAIDNAKLTMGDAIAAAEKASGGKAMEANITTKKKAPIFDVTVLVGDSTKNYTVNAAVEKAKAVPNNSIINKIDR